MKYIAFLALVAFFTTAFWIPHVDAAAAQIFTLKTTTHLGCEPVVGSLYQGSYGAPVENVQHFLVGQGLLATSSVSGYFGDETRLAVIAFQLKQSLISNVSQLGAGTVGPKTAAAMKALCPAPVVENPASGFVSVTQKEVYRKDVRGETRFTYTLTTTPAYGVASWRLTLLCPKDAISTNRRDLAACGDSTEITMGRGGKKTYTISYFNPWRATQMVTLQAEAFDKEGKLLETKQAIAQVFPVYVKKEE